MRRKFFYGTYVAPYSYDPLRLVGILSGELLKNEQNVAVTIAKINKAVNLYRPSWMHSLNNTTKQIAEKDINHLEPIINEIIDGFKSGALKNDQSIDEMLDWAEARTTFSEEDISKARDKIKHTRDNLFYDDTVINVENIRVVKPILLNIDWLYYQDAKTILFPERDLLDKLLAATNERDSYLSVYHPKNKKTTCYFEPKSLIKWLMKKDYLSDWLVSEFEGLKIELVEKSAIICKESAITINKLLKKHPDIDRDEILREAYNENLAIYMKYPRDNLKFGNLTPDEIRHAVSTCYHGMGQLKQSKNDDSMGGYFGGVTIDMLLDNELSSTKNNGVYKIEFVPTEEQAKYGRQPYIEIGHNEIQERISDENLVILESDFKSLIEIEESKTQETSQDAADINLGRKHREQLKKFGRKSAEYKTKEADRKWKPIMEYAYNIAYDSPQKYTAIDLARITKRKCQQEPINADTLRKKIGKCKKIYPYLKQKSKHN